MKRQWLVATAVGLALAAAGCAKEKAGGPGGRPITLTGAGASFPYPLYTKWFDEYGKANPNVRINYQSIGSGGGIQQLKANTVDFGASDAPLSDEEAAAMPGEAVHIPTVAGAVAVVYNLGERVGPLRLDAATLSGIFLGRVKRWNDPRLKALNPGLALPSLEVAVAHRSDGSGTTNIFTSYLSAVSPDWAKRVGAGKSVEWPVGIGGKGNEGVAGVVKQTRGAIGYVELAYAEQNDLARAELRNAAGHFVKADLAATTAAARAAVERMAKDIRVSIVNSPAPDAYPIAGFTYILVYREQADQAKGRALARFLDWAIRDGQALAEPLLYAPLPEGVVALDEAALKTLTSQGQPLLGE